MTRYATFFLEKLQLYLYYTTFLVKLKNSKYIEFSLNSIFFNFFFSYYKCGPTHSVALLENMEYKNDVL